jgi:hypothetical protein
LEDYLSNTHDTLTKKQNRMATMIDHSPNALPANTLAPASPYLHLDNGPHRCGVHVPAAFLRSLHE